MKQNKILVFFGISLIFSTMIRYIQINYTVDFATGFFKIGFETLGYFMLAAIIAVALISTFLKLGNDEEKGLIFPTKRFRLFPPSLFC